MTARRNVGLVTAMGDTPGGMMYEAISGLSSPSASTEAPLEMLAACHGRVEQQCRTLLRLVPHLQAHGADPSARQAARAVMRYFDTAAQDYRPTQGRHT